MSFSFSKCDLEEIINMTNVDNATFSAIHHKNLQIKMNQMLGTTIIWNLLDWIQKLDGSSLHNLHMIVGSNYATVQSINDKLSGSNIEANFSMINGVPGGIKISIGSPTPSITISAASSSSSSIGGGSYGLSLIPTPSPPSIPLSMGGGRSIPMMAHGFGIPMGGMSGTLVRNGQVFHNAVAIGGGRFAIQTPYGHAVIDG